MKILTKQATTECEAIKILTEVKPFDGEKITEEAYEKIKATKKHLFLAAEKKYYSSVKNGVKFDESYHEELFENVLKEREKTLECLPKNVKEKLSVKCAALGALAKNEICFARGFIAEALPIIEERTETLRKSNEYELKKLGSSFDAEMLFEEIVYGISRAGNDFTVLFKDAKLSVFAATITEDELPENLPRFDEKNQYSPLLILKAAEFYESNGKAEICFLFELTSESGKSELFYLTALCENFRYAEV